MRRRRSHPAGRPVAVVPKAPARFGVARRENKAYIGVCEQNRSAICAREEFCEPDYPVRLRIAEIWVRGASRTENGGALSKAGARSLSLDSLIHSIG